MIWSVTETRRGTVLILVLVFVLMISVAAYGFLLSMQTENIAARSSADYAVSQQAALSGCELLAALLEMPRSHRHELGGVSDNPALFGGAAWDQDSTTDSGHAPRFLVLAPQDTVPPEHAAATLYGAADESAKLHWAKLVQWDREQPGSARDALLRLPGMTSQIADALLDWVDEDSQPRLEGAEADAYAALEIPVQPRNGRPLDLDELRIAATFPTIAGGDTGRVMLEPDAERMRIPPDGELIGARPHADRADYFAAHPDGGSMTPRPHEDREDYFARYFTVYSGERNDNRDGLPRVFINDPRLELVHQQLAERMPIAWANFIILVRQYGPGTPNDETTDAGQVSLDFTVPAKHTIESPLDLIDAAVVAVHDGKSVTVASPFSSQPLMMQTQLPELIDNVSVTPATRLEGRVNIHLAPREVLLAVPGIDESLAERILAARTMGGNDNPAHDLPTWLLAEGLVDLPTMRRLLPNITTGGDVFRAEFWGMDDDQSLVYRCEAIIDATEGRARYVYFRELQTIHRAAAERLFDQGR